ncbi:hypothetical protein EUTSA_v10010999mg [Eutrema salsugineum]|uniref:Uncharacterized protein n=1 Tax=Eutrema salsugineum TaxID=72664 RepID=V4NHM1_EUTSA|nr:hypothetical protein EUTSA_v10010999mg [Eutrema salsugineum]
MTEKQRRRSMNYVVAKCNVSILTIKLQEETNKPSSSIFDGYQYGRRSEDVSRRCIKVAVEEDAGEKQKQFFKARLSHISRERQIYEMRKRAELKAAVAELERPWEPVQKSPNLFSICADEQVKVLADRFQKPGGFDPWTDRDGPQLFEAVDENPNRTQAASSKTSFIKQKKTMNNHLADMIYLDHHYR